MTSALPPPLDAYAEAHLESVRRARHLTDELAEAAFNRSRDGLAWSIGECLAHLNLVSEGLVPRLERAATGGVAGTPEAGEHGRMARAILRALAPESPPIRTSRDMDPSVAEAREPLRLRSTLGAFETYAARYAAVCEQAATLDLRRTKVRFPTMSPLPLSLGAYLEISGVHALRHIRQAERVRLGLDAPS